MVPQAERDPDIPGSRIAAAITKHYYIKERRVKLQAARWPAEGQNA